MKSLALLLAAATITVTVPKMADNALSPAALAGRGFPALDRPWTEADCHRR